MWVAWRRDPSLLCTHALGLFIRHGAPRVPQKGGMRCFNCLSGKLHTVARKCHVCKG